MDRQDKLHRLQLFLDRIAPEGGLESLAETEFPLESTAPPEGEEARERELAQTGVAKLARGEEPDDDEMFFVEAIVLPEGRPVIDIQGDSFSAPAGLWAHLDDEPVKTRIEAAIPSIGRLELPRDPRIPYGGTAFVVGEDLLMTNRHVAELFTSGLGVEALRFRPGQTAGVDFRQEVGSSEKIFVKVRKVVMVHPFWDMALLRVRGLPENQAVLDLSTTHPEDLAGKEVAVVGYPAFDPRNDAALQQKIFNGRYNAKRLQPGKLAERETVPSFENQVSAATHDASTLGGNSGSAIVELETGRIVGLHFAGRYLVANYAVPTHELARDSFVVDAGVNFAESLAVGEPPWIGRWRVADPPKKKKKASAAPTRSVHLPLDAPGAAPSGGDGKTATWILPLRISVSVGVPRPARAPGVVGAGDSTAAADALEIEKPRTLPDSDYSNREGYEEGFLGAAHRIALPWLSDEQFRDVAVNEQATSKRHVLAYHHFSLVMNARRRIAFFTAVNMDGNLDRNILRRDFSDAWSVDPRIPREACLENEFYKAAAGTPNPLDRGHLVRRLDPCWGETGSEVLGAHHDTFHWTNCSPQHKDFNRNKTTWGGVENHILNNVNNENLRVTVFTGPVFRADDPVYLTPEGPEVQLPLEYWKVVAMVKQGGGLSATGYLISQKDLVDQLTEAFVFGAYKEFQTSIRNIENLTGLSFHHLADHDPLNGDGASDGTEAPALESIPLESFAGLVL